MRYDVNHDALGKRDPAREAPAARMTRRATGAPA